MQTVVQAAVRLVVRLPGDPAEDTEVPALLPGLQDVELPDGDAGHGEAQADEAVPHESVGDKAERPTGPDWLCEVLFDVNTQVLQVGTTPTVPRVGHPEPSILALAQSGEVPECQFLCCLKVRSDLIMNQLNSWAVI